jgi:hypothetical protein
MCKEELQTENELQTSDQLAGRDVQVEDRDVPESESFGKRIQRAEPR